MQLMGAGIVVLSFASTGACAVWNPSSPSMEMQDVADQDRASSQLDGLCGVWKLVSTEVDGQKSMPGDSGIRTLVLDAKGPSQLWAIGYTEDGSPRGGYEESEPRSAQERATLDEVAVFSAEVELVGGERGDVAVVRCLHIVDGPRSIPPPGEARMTFSVLYRREANRLEVCARLGPPPKRNGAEIAIQSLAMEGILPDGTPPSPPERFETTGEVEAMLYVFERLE